MAFRDSGAFAMWPLNIRSKEDYIRLIQGAMDRQDHDDLARTLAQAFDDHLEDENFTAWCTSVAGGMELADAAVLMARFLERFPMSLHPVQVDWAERLVWQGQLDEGSNEARAYLNRIYSAGLERYFEQYELVRDACSRAFLMLTAVYTEAGARSYSRRVIEYASLLHLDSFWQQRFQAEHRRLTGELANPNLDKLDAQWERFFSTGEGLSPILDLCQKCKLPLLARRMEALATQFATDKSWQVGDEEIFQLLYQTDKGAFVLL